MKTTTLDLILVTYSSSDIAPLDMRLGYADGEVFQVSPLNFSIKQKLGFIQPIVYSPNVNVRTILRKTDILLDSSMSFFLIHGETYDFSTSIDVVLYITGPSTSVDATFLKQIAIDSSISFELANRHTLSSSINSILGITAYRKCDISFSLQESYSLSCTVDYALELSGVVCGLDFITTPFVIGERDIHEFASSVKTTEDYHDVLNSKLEANSSIQGSLEANASITMLLEKEVNI